MTATPERTRSSPEAGLEVVIRLIVPEDVGSGGYHDGPRLSRVHLQAYDGEVQARFRRLSEALTGP